MALRRTQRSNAHDERDGYWSERWRTASLDFVGVSATLVIIIIIGLSLMLLQQSAPFATVVLWSLASLGSGWVVGFLFGIPRVLQHDQPRPPAKHDGGNHDAGGGGDADAADEAVAYRQQVNTNLEQISDWLTKIIVGVGLIELRNVPSALRNLSYFMARGAQHVEDVQGLAVGVVIFFSILGFLGGYLITRIYLAGAFARADRSSQQVNVGGSQLTVPEAVEQQSTILSDLFDQVGKITRNATSVWGTGIGGADTGGPRIGGGDLEPPFINVAEAAEYEQASSPHSILWVDDNPKNNSYLIAALQKKNISVETATSTDEAMQKIPSLHLGGIITDMGRQEGPTYNKRAGIDLIERLRRAGVEVPIVVYCSPAGVAKYGPQAKLAGAVEVTDSPTTLFNALNV